MCIRDRSTVAGILIAQFIGAEDTKEAWCSFDVSLICGIVISALLDVYKRQALRRREQPQAVQRKKHEMEL